jgi:hypothetical protein
MVDWGKAASDVEIVQRFMDICRKRQSDFTFRASVRPLVPRLLLLLMDGVEARVAKQNILAPPVARQED